LPEAALAGCRVADSPSGFAAAVDALLAISGMERRAISERARLDRLSWDTQLAAVPRILEAAARSARRVPTGGTP